MSFRAAKWIHIPIEIQNRELLSRFLLACAAASRGYEVLIGRQHKIVKNLKRLPKGLIFEKSTDVSDKVRMRKKIKKGFVIACSDEESQAIYRNKGQFLVQRIDEETLDNTALYCCWSDMHREFILEKYPNWSSNLKVTGTARTDIWRKEFHPLFEQEVREIKEEFGDFILFNSNFGHVNHYSNPTYMEEVFERYEFESGAAQKESVRRQVSEGRENLNAYKEILPKVAGWFPDRTLIVRPHPTEDAGLWEELVKDLDNAKVVRRGAATAWVLASDVMFHRGCATGTEAGILGKPQVIYAPFPDKVHDADISFQFAPVARTETELKDLLAQAIKSGRCDEPVALEKHFSNISGPFSYQKTLSELEKIDYRPARPTRDILSGKIRKKKKFETLMNIFKPVEIDVTEPSIKWPGISVSELESWAEIFKKNCDDIFDLEIKAVDPDVFWVRKRAMTKN